MPAQDTLNKVPKGKGNECYDWYHYLWHLMALGAVKRRKITHPVPGGEGYLLEADAWELLKTANPGEGATVAQIDTGVNWMHPNLHPRISRSISFATNPYGVRYRESTRGGTHRGPEATLGRSLIRERTWRRAESIASGNAEQEGLIERLKRGRGVTQEIAQISRLRYSAHGTACAGLIVGGPAAAKNTGDDGDGPIPYWGVAPGARLLPIEVSAEPGAEQLIMAFLYCWDRPYVSVIHFPREIPDPWRAHIHKPGHGDTQYISDKDKHAWDYFAKLLERIGEDIPIVCAAGNNGYDRLIYPASKADTHDGIIAVGAVSYRAKRSAYSNYSGDRPGAITIAAPSDDEEVYTRCQIRRDKEASRSRDHNFRIYGSTIPEVEFAPQGVLTTDIPGQHGYAEGFLEGMQEKDIENQDRASLYTVFGGTSAASALVAGAVALLQSKHPSRSGRPLDGKDVRRKLNSSGLEQVSWPWLGGTVRIEPDHLNGEASLTFKQQFGAGLLSLHKLLS